MVATACGAKGVRVTITHQRAHESELVKSGDQARVMGAGCMWDQGLSSWK